MSTILCAKCRSLGYATDCADQLKHEQERRRMIDDDAEFELEITLRFTLPSTSSWLSQTPRDPHDLATHTRETWMTEEADFQDVLLDAVNRDYDLQVRPVFTG